MEIKAIIKIRILHSKLSAPKIVWEKLKLEQVAELHLGKDVFLYPDCSFIVILVPHTELGMTLEREMKVRSTSHHIERCKAVCHWVLCAPRNNYRATEAFPQNSK